MLPRLCPSALARSLSFTTAFLNRYFKPKNWWGFDLDDTLHSTRESAANATRETFNFIENWT
jgi:hypothetical protein